MVAFANMMAGMARWALMMMMMMIEFPIPHVLRRRISYPKLRILNSWR